ncbi:homing endonuclease [Caulobacter phage Cr30]|uniref:homing endonuclease n=1 Tax=Caulobacter phage Cr30 TaxID=1357714 RepID=UPI0004A9B440|nr:homing endonuclease [Caulobacter phage Cr30]AGS81139.1 homing endonuclease [Caulobacter phage Cr30]
MDTYYTIYETTNLLNGMKYRGKHKTENPYDAYLGSGDGIKNAIKKYGKENFSKEILCFCDDPGHMDEMEAFFVDQEWILRKDTYNIRPGGKGGTHKYNQITGRPKGSETSKEKRENISKSKKGKVHVRKISEPESKSFLVDKNDPLVGIEYEIIFTRKGKFTPLTQEHKDKISETRKARKIKPWNVGISNEKTKSASLKTAETRKRNGTNKITAMKAVETKRKNGTDGTGRKWWNNGIENKFQKEIPGIHWIPGKVFRLRKRKNS